MGLPHGVSPITFFCVHNISLYISNSFQIHSIFYLYIIQILLLYSSTDKLRSSVFTSLVYIQTNILYVRTHFPCTYQILFIQNFYLYITQILFENTFSQINFDLSFLFRLYIQLNTIGIERSIIPCETAFKSMGHPYGVSPNTPMYIHLSLYINTRSCTYLFPCTQFKLVNNQVTLVLNVRFTDTCLYFINFCK